MMTAHLEVPEHERTCPDCGTVSHSPHLDRAGDHTGDWYCPNDECERFTFPAGADG